MMSVESVVRSKDLENAVKKYKMFKANTSDYLDWRQYVGEWIEACREDGGIPMFRTKFDVNVMKAVVLGVCYGGENKVGSVHFVNVPMEDLVIIENTTGEWRIFERKYGKGVIREGENA